jgi:hypothetical protein
LPGVPAARVRELLVAAGRITDESA